MSTEPSLDNHYSRWSEKQCIDKFAAKTLDDFFDSEHHFLKQMTGNASSVLDIGCASGHFLQLLRSYFETIEYMGVDIMEGMIEHARTFYPEARFLTANALTLDLDETFDIVNATGVFQHEPGIKELLQRMIDWSNRYVLFDVKFAEISGHIIDLSQSYTRGDAHNMYFNLFHYPSFIELCRSMPGVQRIEVFGYFTAPNSRTTIPAPLTRVVSANVLIEKGDISLAPPDIPVRVEADDEVLQVLQG